ncbi:putative bifunctional diguanylate cyclase/phosphodiesterase [Caenibius tardaugens]|nr:bifunctional diguanylate cyclase/phosphodiesterase [Caenibius tardaugens]AZI37201.1 GGDEF domain-containing protein [Caenibius tardaugens NBRC 16725]
MPFDPQQPERVDVVALNILKTISSPLSVEESSCDVTASIGIAQTCGTSPTSAEQVIHEADIAMYQAKKAGRNRYSWFNPAMESELRIRSDLENSIRKAIAEGEFVPYYQQQVDIETGDLVGFEMLAHWQAPHMNGITAEVFIPVAEEIGAIAALSESLIRTALNDAKQWDPRLVLSVNISPVQLRDPWFSQKLLHMLIESGFPPERLEIEITESCLHDQIGTVRSMITSLKNQGIRISLDDFGSGYSSLTQLRSLPFDQLKIDRSFVTGLADDEANRKLVEAIVSLAKGLNLPVTAEGIESEPVHQVLRSMGAMKGQGFLYGKPQSAWETSAMLAERNLLIAPMEHPAPDDRAHRSLMPKHGQAG